jgi:hypothetical protein
LAGGWGDDFTAAYLLDVRSQTWAIGQSRDHASHLRMPALWAQDALQNQDGQRHTIESGGRMSENFVPAWVENKLQPKKADQELELLRHFFDSWEALHAIKGDKRNPEIRQRAEQAAQVLVDAAMAIRAYRVPPLNGG